MKRGERKLNRDLDDVEADCFTVIQFSLLLDVAAACSELLPAAAAAAAAVGADALLAADLMLFPLFFCKFKV